MNSQRFRYILLGALGLCVVVFMMLCVFGLSMLRSESDKMVQLKLQNRTADAQLANLNISKKEIEKYSYFKSIAATVIPNDKDQAKAVLDIFQLADQSGISIQSITFPSSNLGLRTVTPVTPSGSTSTTPSSSSSAIASGSSSKLISQAMPVTGIPGLYSIQLTITPETGPQVPAAKQVNYSKVLDFLRRIENNRRTAQITEINIQPVGSAGSKEINFSLTVNIFIKP
jgi:hypothetical protein